MRREMNPNVEKAYQYLLKRIMSFELEPGEAIVDNQVAKQLDMSRAPVREAVLQLVTDGMVQSVDGKMAVAPININDIVDILRVRVALESECFRIIAAKGWLTPAQEKKLRSIHVHMSESADTATISEHYSFDDAFHGEIVNAADSPRISAITEQMRLQMQRARWLNLAVPNRQQEAICEHEKILGAVLRHDLPEASESMREHLENSENAFRDVISSKQTQQMIRAIGCFFS